MNPITIVERLIKGTALTAQEHDDNLNALKTASEELDATQTGILNSVGAANGIASLDGSGLVPTAQLPSYVDDVVEVATYAALPVTGEASKIYIVVADETQGGDTSSYRWTGTVYALVSNTLTAADVLTLIKTVDGTGSGLDADLLDGLQPSALPISTETQTALNLKAPLASPALTNPTINGIAQSGHTGFKNYLINGNFDIWQRGDSFILTTSNAYTADRWEARTLDMSVDRVFLTEIQTYGLKVSTTTVIGCPIGQKIEDVSQFNGKTLSLSFKAKSSTSSNFRVLIYYYDTSGLLITSQTIDSIGLLTTTLEDYSMSWTVPDLSASSIKGNTSYMLVSFDTAIAAIQDYTIAEVQLEEGSVATPFENRPYGLELSLCQRYYESGLGAKQDKFLGVGYVSSATTAYSQTINFKTEKRAIPTVTLLNTIAVNITLGTLTANNVGAGNFRLATTNSTGGTTGDACLLTADYTADAEL